MKKLISAVALLVVSALLLVTSSYAWFSMNTTVEAVNMRVTATTSRNLVIALASDEEYHQSINVDSQLDEMSPVSTINLTDWFTTSQLGVDKTDFDSGEVNTPLAEDFVAAINGAKNYFYTESFKIKVAEVDGEDFDTLYVKKITVTGDESLDISKSIRVGIKSGSTIYFYSPHGGDSTWMGVSITGTTLTLTSLTSAPLTTVSTLGDVGPTTVVDVDIFIWYEGQDSNCSSANAVDVEELTIGVVFEAVNN